MASTPPFQMEDQTDEDFFDKLVDDDFVPIEAQPSSLATEMKFEDENDSDDATVFANLSIGEDSAGDKGSHEANPGPRPGKEAVNEPLPALADGDGDSSLVALETVEPVDGDANNSRDKGMREGTEVLVSETAGEGNTVDESRGSGVKTVSWNSLFADSPENIGQGFGSFSDFFSELGGNVGSFQGKVEENVIGGENLVTQDTENKSLGLHSPVEFEQYQDDQVHGNFTYQSANGQDISNSLYWENLYPGLTYDANTGQWYQVDGHDGSMNLQGNFGDQGGVYWNKEYPEHMVFDPQYPGWYYDMISQEWRALDSYFAAAQSTGDAHGQQVQNAFVSTGGYPNPNDSNSNTYGEYGQEQTNMMQEFGNQSQQGYHAFSQQQGNMWQVDAAAGVEATVTSASLSSFGGDQQVHNFYGTEAFSQQPAAAQSFENTSQGHFEVNGIGGMKSFIPVTNLSQHINAASVQQNGPVSFSNDFYGMQTSVDLAQQSLQSSQRFSHAPAAGRSPDGRPPHAPVTFGFGGKLIVMKDKTDSPQNSSLGSQGTVRSSISIFNLAEVISGNLDASSIGDSFGYFRCLYQQPLPGPLVGGNVGSKDLYKWLDERITNCESPDMDFTKGKLLRLLLSLLKISCQHYGNLRSSFATDTIQKEMDTPEAAVAKLFASAVKNDTQSGACGALSQCLWHLPPEEQIRATASEVQRLLVSGKKIEALQCAQGGQLWGPALVIAAQLGEQFYVDTVKQMALLQLVPGSPLRTLCLLIAGQPAEVFSAGDTSNVSHPGFMIMPQNQSQFGTNSILDNWEENLAIITANRTKDDRLVITHLGDCLWKERSEIIAAHVCYLIAENNFEPYSDTARICLIGVDHWKYPRTYASPEAIQRTELYEYSKVLGNPQYILLPFQPYKLIYALMLVEVGKVSDALKYCQAILKCLKTGRTPEVETWKQLAISLEERIRIHQQGGFAANLAPAKLVGKLLNFFDSTAHRVVGGMPPPAPSSSSRNFQVNEYQHQQAAPGGLTSRSTMTMSTLMPSASMEPIREWAGDGSKMVVHARSVSEPDFGRRPRQDQVSPLKEKAADGPADEKSSDTGTGSRFGRLGFGSQFLKKTVGLVLRPRPSKEAKLGEKNKFYYDEKLKRWVEEGAEPPAEESALPPPPTTAAFQSNSSDFGINSELKNEMSPSSGGPNFSSPPPSENSSGIPPIPSSSNQFSARGRTGVRARYVDTFNQGHSNSATKFKSPSVPSVGQSIPANAKFFIPTTPATPANEQGTESAAEATQEGHLAYENSSVEAMTNDPFQTPASSTMTRQRFPSMDNVGRSGSATIIDNQEALPSAQSRRTASWSGSFNGSFSPTSSSKPEVKQHSGEASSMSPFMPSPLNSSSSFGDDLHEVEL